MRVIHFTLAVLLVIGLTLLAHPAKIAAAPIQIAVNNTMPPGGAEEASILKFKELVEQKSKGQMVVTPFMSGQLGGEIPVLSLLKIGKSEISLTGGLFLSQFCPEYNPMYIPYLLTWE